MPRYSLVLGVIALGASTFTAPRFVTHEIATGLTGGYQVIAADLNKDGKPDLLVVASGLPDLAWYENPSWTRHVLAPGLPNQINVAATDLDGDGIPEVAVAYGFSTRPDQSVGNVALLTHGSDVTTPWTMREIDRMPTSHRLRWFTTTRGEKWLVNAPLAGATSQPPDYKGATSLYFYRAPDWKRELLNDQEQGVVHAIEPVRWDRSSPFVLLSAGFMGIHEYANNGSWMRSAVSAGNPVPWPNGGSSDVAIGHLGGERFIAAIEPWHGNQVAVYRDRGGSWERSVIDSSVVDGHALVTADFDNDGKDEIVVGQRGGSRSVWLYASSGGGWTRLTVDDGTMAGAGCTAADLNGDGRVDLACVGTATANLKWYENVTFKGPGHLNAQHLAGPKRHR